MWERLLDKMEALFNKKYGIFLIILWALTIISVSTFIIIPILWGNNESYHGLFKIYATNAWWMLFVSLMLWLIYLGDRQEIKENWDKLDKFLEWRYSPNNPNNKNLSKEEVNNKTFSRQNLVDYIYREENTTYNSSTPEYKKWGKTLRKAINKRITIENNGENWCINYKRI